MSFLSDERLRAASKDEKTSMMRSLLSDLAFSSAPDEAELMRTAVTQLVLGSKTPGELDYLLSRVDSKAVERNLSGPQRRAALKLIAEAHQPKPGDWDGYRTYLEQATGATSSGANALDFLVDGTEFEPKLFESLAKAQHSINVSMFELQGDEVGQKVVDALAERARAGVKVRVLLDEFGSSADAKVVKGFAEQLRAAGGEVIFNPAPLDRGNLDHRKLIVVDGKEAFTGGMNLGVNYQRAWHDQQTHVVGPAVERLQQAFFTHWGSEGGALPLEGELAAHYQGGEPVPGGAETYVVAHEGHDVDHNIKLAYLRAFGTAEKSICLSNPYFTDQDVIAALVAAAKRGVKVQVVLPAENDMRILQSAARAYYPDLLAAGVEVYEYQGRMAHQKVAVVDGKWATTGSSNLDARSLEYNDELNLVVLDERFAGELQRELYEVDLPRSRRITEAHPDTRQRLHRLLSPYL